jgi:fermentation-respiration switch protein FrsA (DUF1100 family)
VRFLVHGTADPVIPYHETELLAAAARDPKVVWLVTGIGHTLVREHLSGEYHRRVLEFLDRAR